ncbi:glycosyltransferase family 39 protein [Alicyclobacillus acidoterrestris]|uniref:glycosyltransferase family 39 protein n=1 Tax=Alicyclobacillus TaxID=29330 RepID=UPI001A8D7443|nr:glycosyltransferase family 39 protein [Alicyclobacillus suci]
MIPATRTFGETVRFGLVGTLNTAVDFAIFILLTHVGHWDIIAAQTVSYAVGLMNSYVWNRIVTFKEQGSIGWKQVGRFVAINVSSYLVSVFVLFVMRRFACPDVVSKLFATLVTFAINFIGSKRWVFSRTAINERSSSSAFRRKEMVEMDASYTPETGRQRLPKLLSGRQEDAPWVRPALVALLVLTAVAYIWGLSASGWSNSFYSAAVQAATKSWKAFFFGSFDASNFITVDKPPFSLWVMDLSARIFGLNSWSILVPEALEGVACVWVLYLTVRRWFSPGAALIAGAVLATTPVAALMFRFNNPDALLVLLLTASAYAMTRALEAGKTKWLILASCLIGLGFLTKMLAAFLVIPGFVVVYLLFAPVSVRRRLLQLVSSAIVVVVSAGWWVAIVQLTPADKRPYIGSSQDNSLLNLIFGYNGFGRLTGNESSMGGGRGGHGGGMFSGSTGIARLFHADMGGQISWLIPAALILFFVALWLVRRAWRSEDAVPALLMWAATLIVTGLAFSFGKGIIHQYYTVALAPAIGALVGIGSDVLWRSRNELVARLGLAVAMAATAVWSFVLLDRTPTWLPWLRVVVLVVGAIAVIGILCIYKMGQRITALTGIIAVVAGLVGPFAYMLQTVTTPHTGSTPTAGPTVAGAAFGGGGFGNRRMMPGFESGMQSSGTSKTTGSDHWKSGSSLRGANGLGDVRLTGGFGGPGDATPNQAIIRLLEQNATHYTWVAATIGANSAAPYQLATGDPIMAIGGFAGSDPTPTLAQFKRYVSEGKIHYFIAGGMGFGRGFLAGSKPFGGAGDGSLKRGAENGEMPAFFGGKGASGAPTAGGFPGGAMGGSSSPSAAITKWVESHFTSTKVGGVTVYDLTHSKS